MSKAIIICNSATTGTSTTSFAQRPLTSIQSQLNPDGTSASFVTLTSNQFTLAAGVYRITGKAKATGTAAENVGIQLYNITAAAAVANTEDAQQVAVLNENVDMYFDCAFVLASSSVFELRGKGSVGSTNGYGIAIAGAAMNLATIEILKTA